MKKCIKCNIEKPLDSFPYRNKLKGTLHSGCKECRNIAQKQRWNKNTNGARDKGRAASRNYNYKNRYNMPEEVIQQLLKDAHGNCEICGQHTKLFVDHCHTTEKYRGLLCRACNLMLGYAKDNLDTLSAGIKYLQAEAS